jgi:dihydrodiol dehydrogenase / D-xylose 1-dehydrogenase (NADP)
MTVTTRPPPPLDDTSITTNPLDCPPLRWGMLGCGRVSHDFCLALNHVPTATVTACAARDGVRAQEFADKHGIAKAYGGAGYDDLLSNVDIDIIYVGNVHAFRRIDVAKCIEAGKHVLVEKPFACTAEDARYLVDLARKRNVFLMEGMWTRFFPAVEHVSAFFCLLWCSC